MQNLNMFFAYCHARILDVRSKDEGATAVEYGLLVALIAIVLIATVTTLGGNLGAMFGRIATRFTTLATP